MKRLSLILCAMLIAVLPVLQSCDDNDGYSLGNFTVRMATVRIVSGNTYYLEIDNGRTLWPAATQIPGYKPIDGQRVVADYTLLSDEFQGYDHAIRVNYLSDVLTKTVESLTGENEADFGDDPVEIYNMWVGANYLNVEFQYFLPSKTRHLVSLVQNTTVESPDDDYIHLEYRYNTYDDVTNRKRWGIVSFNLGEYGPDEAAADYKGIKIRINSAINGERVLTYDFPVKGSDANLKTIEGADELDADRETFIK